MIRPISRASAARLALVLALPMTIAIGIAGCAASKGTPAPGTAGVKGTPSQEEAERLEREELRNKEQIPVALTAGTADRRDPEHDNMRLYTVSWQNAVLRIGRPGIEEGKMNGVTGIVYEEQKTKSTFAAEIGYAKKETQTLYLEGKVVVKSPEYRATLRAEKLEWLPDVKRYRATGNVTLTTPNGAMGPIPVMLATSDLQRVGTPDLFSPK